MFPRKTRANVRSEIVDDFFSSLLDELGVNSLQLTEIIMDLEDMFEIELSENTSEAWARLKTVGDVVEAVQAVIDRKT